MRARPLLLGLALAAACSSRPVGEFASYRGPSAVSVFMGWTAARPGELWPYLAVANARGDELRIVDPASDRPLLSPGHVFPLSVPTLARPLTLATASLYDGEPDALLVTGVGTVVELVATWADGIDRDPANPEPPPMGPGVEARYDLSLLGLAGPGARILSMVGAPVPGTPAGTPPVAPPVPGRARVLVGLSGATDGLGGKLVVLELERLPGGRVGLAGGGPPGEVKPLGFDPLALAPSPDNLHLYCATPDLITDTAGGGQVRGVAEVDMSPGLSAPWPVRGLSARNAGTTLVAAAMVGERLPTDPDAFGPPALRVYGALDMAACGRDRDIECGIATFDPASGGLAADPAPAGTVDPQTYRTPLWIPAVPLAMAVALPPATGPQLCFPKCTDPRDPTGVRELSPSQPLMFVAAGSGRSVTSAIAVVAAADGNSYVLDLGRYSTPNDVSMFNPAGGRDLRVVSPFSAVPVTAPDARLGLFVDQATPGNLTADADKLASAIVLTPGFTRTESWTLAWQGGLPGLHGSIPRPLPGEWPAGSGLPCVAGLCAAVWPQGCAAGGSLYLAMQRPSGTSWLPTARVGDPVLGIHPAEGFPEGDFAEFKANADPPGCQPTGVAHEARVARILLPVDPAAPGGALELALAAPGSDLQCLADHLAAQAPGTFLAGECYVRASRLVLSGASTGYAGRPQLRARYNFKWSEESLLGGEELILARKARRFLYPGDPCLDPKTGAPPCTSPVPELSVDSRVAGPVIGFTTGVACPGATSGTWLDCQDTQLQLLPRGAFIGFFTDGGIAPMSRAPATLSLPSHAAALDKSPIPGQEGTGTVVYVAYEGNEVLEVLPGAVLTASPTLR